MATRPPARPLEPLRTVVVPDLNDPAANYVLPLRTEREPAQTRRHILHEAEMERTRLARELHDDIGHALTTAIMQIDLAAIDLDEADPATRALALARRALQDCIQHVQDIAFSLRPRMLDDLGLTSALQAMVRRVDGICGVSAELTVDGTPRRLSSEIELAAFRIAQEALTNALKHAHAGQIGVHLVFGPQTLGLEIRDDGVGFVAGPCDPARSSGNGLAGMRERAELADGRFEYQSVLGAGTTISVHFFALGGLDD